MTFGVKRDIPDMSLTEKKKPLLALVGSFLSLIIKTDFKCMMRDDYLNI